MNADPPEVVADSSWASSPGRRRTMQSIRSKDTKPELMVRQLLHSRGLRYRVDWPLPFDRRRRTDIAFTRARIAIFIDGCFWHSCPVHYRPPAVNSAYWREKMAGNSLRDEKTTAELNAAGWTVLRFWEHEDPEVVAMHIEAAVRGVTPMGQSR